MRSRACARRSPARCACREIPSSIRPAPLDSCCRKLATLGARVIHGQPVAAIGKGTARLADGTVFAAGFIINAAGQSAPQLSRGINIKPRKGHLVITDRYPNFLRHQVVELGYLKSAHSLTADSVAFNVQPRKTGQILIGSSRQYGARKFCGGRINPRAHAAARIRIHARPEFTFRDSRMDRFSSRHSR